MGQLHSTAFDCIQLHSTAFNYIQLHSTAFNCIQRVQPHLAGGALLRPLHRHGVFKHGFGFARLPRAPLHVGVRRGVAPQVVYLKGKL
jgi:hypothetical protein